MKGRALRLVPPLVALLDFTERPGEFERRLAWMGARGGGEKQRSSYGKDEKFPTHRCLLVS